MAFHHDGEIRVLREELFQKPGVVRESLTSIGPDVALVVIEESILRLLLQ
jgi:hypothetical protein